MEVILPAGYRGFATSDRDFEVVDESTVLSDPQSVISATKEFRRGFAGLEPWPNSWIYIGDEADACPYALDCKSGILRRLDKGNISRKPLEEFTSFDEFLANRMQNK